MTRAAISGTFLACLLGLISCATAPEVDEKPPAEPPVPSRPNILFIMTDDHATEAISCYGSYRNRTPRIDELASQGVRFDRAYCTNGICAPSRACVLTGKLSHRHGVISNAQRFDGSQVTLPKLLREVGYQTALVGKWHLKSEPTGFDYWTVLPGQGIYYNPTFIEMGKESVHQGYVTDLTTDFALDWLERRDPAKPFFLMLHHKAPHRNWMPHFDDLEEYGDIEVASPATLHDEYPFREAAAAQEMSISRHLHSYYDLKGIPDADDPISLTHSMESLLERMSPAERARWEAWYAKEAASPEGLEGVELTAWKYQRYIKDYLRCIASVDRNVGRVLDYLATHDLDDNTVVIYTSDQGFFLGEHGWYDKRFMYEESARMPLLVRYPPEVPAGTRNESLVMNIDFAPTMLEFAGATVPEAMQGRSFASVARTGRDDGRDSVYYHYFEYPGVHAVKRHYGIRTHRYKLIHFYHDIDTWELFDLQEDPRELENVYNSPGYWAVKAFLHAELHKLQVAYGDTEYRRGLDILLQLHRGVGARIDLAFPPADRYRANGASTLVDGRYRDHSIYLGHDFRGWLGFREHDLMAEIELRGPGDFSRVALHTLEDPAAWIYHPRTVSFYGSTDGETYELIDTLVAPEVTGQPSSRFWEIEPGERGYRQIRVVAERREAIPAGMPGAGQVAWLFADEIMIDR